VPTTKYSPWFAVVLKGARLSVKVLQLLSQETRASKLRWARAASAVGLWWARVWALLNALPAGCLAQRPRRRPAAAFTHIPLLTWRHPSPFLSPLLPACPARSFNDIVKRLAAQEATEPTFVSKRADVVERFVVAHGQIVLNQFQNYPGGWGWVVGGGGACSAGGGLLLPGVV
jgi:hypothetical protein